MSTHQRIARVARGDDRPQVAYQKLDELVGDLRKLWIDYVGERSKREDAERECTRLRNVTREAMDEITLAVCAAAKRSQIGRTGDA